MTKELIEKMEKCRHLLPEPGAAVFEECLKEIRRLRALLPPREKVTGKKAYEKALRSLKRHQKRVGTLFDADLYCWHELDNRLSGIKCKKCGGWFCL